MLWWVKIQFFSLSHGVSTKYAYFYIILFACIIPEITATKEMPALKL